MQAQRKGTNLKIAIRLALLSLGRDPHVKLKGSIAELETQLKNLRREQMEKGIVK